MLSLNVQAAELNEKTRQWTKLNNFYATGMAIAAVDDGQSLFKDNCGTPLWVVLNKGDRAEPVGLLNQFAAKYRKFGGKIKITLLEGSGHNAWDRAFGDKKFVTMLFRQKRK